MKAGHIRAVQKKGTRINSKYATLYTANVTNQREVACVVSKMVAASAVRRHKLQRWMREITRSLRKDYHLQNDFVWIAKPSLNKIESLQELRQSIEASHDTLLAAERIKP